MSLDTKSLKLNELELKLEKIKLDMEFLKEKATLKGKESESYYQKVKADFDEKMDWLKKEIKETKEKSGNAASDLKDGFFSAFDEMKDAFNKAKERF